VYAVTAHQLHRAGFIRLWSGGPCFPFLVFISTSMPAAHQLHRAGFARLWHPRMHLFIISIYLCLLSFTTSSPHPPVVVAFGRPPFCGISLRAQLTISVCHLV
jgi:hypothetical protein